MDFNFFSLWYVHPKTGGAPMWFKTQQAGGLQEDKYIYLLATDSCEFMSCPSLEV